MSFNLLESLRIFRKVVEIGSFSGAARQLRLTPAWTAKSMEHLEAHLGATLLQRSTRRLLITEAGRQCYETAQRMLGELAALETHLADAAKSAKGRVKISAPMALGVCELGPLIGEFSSSYPDIELQVVLDDRFVNLIEGDFDLALRVTGTLPDSRLLVRQLRPVRRISCAAPAYLEKHGRPAEPEDLNHHAGLVFSPMARSDVWCFRSGSGEITVQPRRRIVANNSLLLRSALLAGAGIALIPEFIVRDDLAEGRVEPLLPGFEADPLHLFLLRPADRRQPRRVRLFAEFLAARLARPSTARSAALRS